VGEIIFANSGEEVGNVFSLVSQAEELLNRKIGIKILIMSRFFLTSLVFRRRKSLEITREHVRTNILEQQGYCPDGLMVKNDEENRPLKTVVGKDSDNEIFFQKDFRESPSVILEMISESKKDSSLINWKNIIYWNLGNFKKSAEKSGLWLDKTGVLLFREEVERLEEGQVINVKDWDKEFRAYVVENGNLHKIWGNVAV